MVVTHFKRWCLLTKTIRSCCNGHLAQTSILYVKVYKGDFSLSTRDFFYYSIIFNNNARTISHVAFYDSTTNY